MIARIAKVVCLSVVIAAPCRADQPSATPQSANRVFLASRSGALVGTSTAFVAALNRLLDASPAFAREAGRAAGRGGRVAVVSKDELMMATFPRGAGERFGDVSVARAMALRDLDGVIRTVLVVVNFEFFENAVEAGVVERKDMERDLERVLVHEIYGHALPWLLYGDAGTCQDPLPQQVPIDACSIRRENRVRAEAGLGLRTDFGVASLAVGSRENER